MNRVLFSSASDEWATPKETFDALNAEFSFADDACPLGGDANGLLREWGSPCFVNPPYSDIRPWMEKAVLEWGAGKTVVLLVPSRTDTRWWHDYAMRATEIRFLRGRLKFGTATTGAPFPSCVVIFQERSMTPRPAPPMGEQKRRRRRGPPPWDRAGLDAVIRTVCRRLGVTEPDIMGRCRHLQVVLARDLIAYVGHRYASYPQIAKRMARRMHSTYTTAARRMERAINAGERTEYGGCGWISRAQLVAMIVEDVADEVGKLSTAAGVGEWDERGDRIRSAQ